MLHRTLALVLVLVWSSVSAAAGLREDVERLIRLAPIKNARISVSIRDAQTGRQMVGINSREQMLPASNMKLITSGAALHALGPSFEFTTQLLLRDDVLLIVGSGDPGFGDPVLLSQMSTADGLPLDIEGLLGVWTTAVKQAGVTRIRELVVDDRVFDREFVHPTWPRNQLNRDYCAQVAGLNVHANVLHFYPQPRSGMTPDISDVRPRAPWLKIANSATSKTSGKADHAVGIARKLGTNELMFHGNVRFKASVAVEVTFDDPPAFFAQLLTHRLKAAGVDVGRFRVADAADPASEGQAIGPVIVTPMRTILARCNQESMNLYAEALLKRLGHDLTGDSGSWLNGSAVIRHIVHERLQDPKLAGDLIVSDGSGLSRDNRITAELMTAWLDSIESDPKIGEAFLESLAVGAESGTLRKRYQSIDLNGALVQAKTGYIDGVSCLSGYVTAEDGRRRAFSVLVNGFGAGGVTEAKKLQDQIVRAIARDLAATAPANLATGSEIASP